MNPVKILLIDDHALFRSGLRLVLLSGLPDVQVLKAPAAQADGSRAAVSGAYQLAARVN